MLPSPSMRMGTVAAGECSHPVPEMVRWGGGEDQGQAVMPARPALVCAPICYRLFQVSGQGKLEGRCPRGPVGPGLEQLPPVRLAECCVDPDSGLPVVLLCLIGIVRLWVFLLMWWAVCGVPGRRGEGVPVPWETGF